MNHICSTTHIQLLNQLQRMAGS